MARKKQMLQLPAQAGKDMKTLAGILDKWVTGAEEIAKDVLLWAKKHKFLVLAAVGLAVFYRYWLAEPEEEKKAEEEDY